MRAPCCEKMGLKKGPWTPDEDQILISFIQRHGHRNWRALPKQAGLLRCGKSCRLRWKNYLQPDIKRGNFSKEEDETIIKLHQVLGNRWSAIAGRLPGRTDNEIKNYWHTHLKKGLKHNLSSTKRQSNETVQPQRDTNNESRTSKPEDNLETHQKPIIQSPNDYIPILQQQSHLESSNSMSTESTDDASGIFFGSTTDFDAKRAMNFGSSSAMDFWYNIYFHASS